MARLSTILAAMLAAALIAGCRESGDKEPPLPPRPVLTTTLTTIDPQVLGYSGTVEPRFETKLAFRTLGRMVSRQVDVGDSVKKGEPLATIDAQSLDADMRSAKAQLDSAEIQDRNARAAADRTKTLFSEKTVSQSQLDDSRQSLAAAEAQLVNAKAQLAKAQNALSYAILAAPYGGVITARQADIGQVVSAGEQVMTLARTDQLEAVIDVPSDQMAGIAIGTPFETVLQIDPSIKVMGKVREIAPQADALTRTQRVRIMLDKPPTALRIGSIIEAVPAEKAKKPIMLLPPEAILKDGDKTLVWVVDTKAKTVRRQAIEIETAVGGQIILLSGLKPGAVIVTAGIHSLKEGQTVSLSGGLPS
ncbi:efflux RND transporter periplasmic adaptor subunit [Jiella sp. CQZ9-1]|uniref:Efflux RND transporter periplasmic adaptor subunit n=2 Tax=Jiella flava TaxID=2816857 RepID=A0A939JQP4_9HYPH|nr:efflux RND transporter periplasmic adaptor subunit [Jiella flava]